MTQPAPQAPSIAAAARLVVLNLWFWTVAPAVTLLFIALGIPYIVLFHLVLRDHRRTLRLIRRTISWYGAVVIRCGWPLARVSFVDYAPQDTPPFIFISNHCSSSDGFIMGFLPFECIEVINNWSSRLPGVGQFATAAGYLKIRQMSVEEFDQAASQLLAQGVSIIAFPEGTRAGTRPMGQFHGTVFRVAQNHGAKIVPLALSGTQECPRRGSILLRPTRIVLSKLPAITRQQYEGMSPFKLKTTVRDMIRQQLERQTA